MQLSQASERSCHESGETTHRIELSGSLEVGGYYRRIGSPSSIGVACDLLYATGRKLTETDALGRITRWDYDPAGRVISRTLPAGQAERFTYDNAGRLVGYTDFGNQTTTYVYDAASNLKEKLLPDGTRVVYDYFAGTRRLSTATRNVPAGVLGSVAIGGNAETTTIDRLSYDAAGRIIQSSDANSLAHAKAVVMNLFIVGEAATKIMERHSEFVVRHSEIPWRSMRGMRPNRTWLL